MSGEWRKVRERVESVFEKIRSETAREWLEYENNMVRTLYEENKRIIDDIVRTYGICYDFIETVLRTYVRTDSHCPFCGAYIPNVERYILHILHELANRGKTTDWFVNVYGGEEERIEEEEAIEAIVTSIANKILNGYIIDLDSIWAPEYPDAPPVLWYMRIEVRDFIPREKLVEFFKELYNALVQNNIISRDEFKNWIDFIFGNVIMEKGNGIITIEINVTPITHTSKEMVEEHYPMFKEVLGEYLPPKEEILKEIEK